MSGLAAPRIIYGVHSISPYSRTDHTPYGILKVIGSAQLSLSSPVETLYAGSNKYPWAAENKSVATGLKAKVKAYPGFLFQLFLGATVTVVSGDASGTVSTPANKLGTSVIAAAGIATIGVLSASKANLKFGQYVLKALTSSTLGIFLLSDIDITRGTTATYTDDTLLLVDAISISTTVATNITDLGLVLTGGATTTAFVVGDTATFSVLPLSSQSTQIVVGQSTDTFPAFGALLLAQKRATGEMFEIDAHYCVGGGLPIDFSENAFSQPELSMTCLYDSTLNRVFTMRHIIPS